jgi:hypothetical protein
MVQRYGSSKMPQKENGDMFTGMGVKIKLDDLTAVFTFFGKAYPVGKFDPSAYPEMKPADTPWQKLGQEIMDQLDDSGFWTNDELVTISMMSPEDFLMCLSPMSEYWKQFPNF